MSSANEFRNCYNLASAQGRLTVLRDLLLVVSQASNLDEIKDAICRLIEVSVAEQMSLIPEG